MGVRIHYLYFLMAFMVLGNHVAALTITYSPSTNVYTISTAITTLTPTVGSGPVGAFGFGTATALTGATLNNPRGIAIDASGNIYVTNSGNNTISRYNSSGTYLGTFGTGATMSFPKDLVFDSSGNAYVLNLGATPGTGTVYKYNSSGVYQSTILSGLNYALGITIDASDNIYIADQGAVTVTKYSTSGTLLLSLPTTNFSTPLGVATDASGDIYVLNNGTGNVTKYNSAGTFQSTFVSGFTSAQAIAIDGAGNIYVSDNAATNVVKVYNLSGTLLTTRTVTDGQGVAVDKSGNMFVSSYYSNQMNKFAPTGGYFLSTSLPAGLSFNSSTGAISGTPTVTMATTTFTVTAYSGATVATTTVTITVNPTVPTGTGGSTCNSGTVLLTASGSTPSGGVYSWYAALTGGFALATGATYTTPTITATTIYYVSYTQNGATSTPRTAVTATVNASPAIATAPTSPTASLYLSYPFTGNASDVSGNSNNGTLQNAPTSTTDRYGVAGSAYSFNGTSQYVSTTTSTASPGPQIFSISVWFKTSSAGGKLVGFGNLQTGSSASYDRQVFMGNSGQIYFGLYMSGTLKTINTAASYADGSWHHAVATESTTNGANLYVDGVLQATDGTLTNSQSYAGYWRIGYDNMAFWGTAPTNYYFNGSLDDVAIYKTELTAAQVYALYGGGSAPVCVGSTMTLQANTVAGATYAWTGPNSFTSALQNPTIASVTAANAGVYTLTVTGTNGCTSQLNVTGVVNSSGPALASVPTSPAAGLYLSYPFSGNASDVSGNSNNGTLQNSPTLTTDHYGAANSAYSFNGTNQYVSTTTSIASPGPQNFSISIWFKTSSAGGRLIGYGASQTGASGNNDRHIYMSNAGLLYFGLYPSAYKTINTTTGYADGNWHHVVATESTTNGANLYVDGVLQATDATMKTSQSFAGYWKVGYDNMVGWPSVPTSLYFNGSLDDVAIYNSELTASQVYALYGGGSAPVCAGSTMALQANTVAGATYAWTGPSSFTSALQNPTIAGVTAANAGVYTLTVTSTSGCSSQLSVTGVVNALPSATFTATSTVSINSAASITYTGTDPSTSTYSWDFNGGTPSTGTGQGPFNVQWATTGTKTITLNITNANGCTNSSTQSVTVAASYGNYAFQDAITLNTTSLGITSNLTNFPALLSIQDNDLIISNTCADKVQNPNGPNYDFAFVSGASELYYQVESYNQTTGTLLVWVQIPSLTFAANNVITFYFGSKSPPVTHNAAFFANTWASNYLAVFHFNEASYTGSVADGTAGGHTGTTSGMTSADLVAGKIGTAYSFNGSTKKITTNAVSTTGAFTLSAWVKLGATGLDQKIMTNQAATGGFSGGYKLAVFTTNYPEVESGIASNRASTPNPTALASGTWYYVQGVYTGTTLSTYVNGVAYKTLTIINNPSANANFYIGVGEGGTGFYFNGTIDEPRVSNVAKTPDWLKAEYGNQNNPVTFTTVGTTLTNITNAAAIPGALTYTYKGVTGTYTDAANWDNTTAGTTNQAPAFDGTANLIIPTGTSIALNSDAAVYGLTLSGTATVSLSANLSVACNIYNQGTGKIDWNNLNTSKITWNGSSATQSYNGSTSTGYAHVGTMELNNSAAGTLTINNDTLAIYSLLTITKGSLVVATPGTLTLKSSATQTAAVSVITNPAYKIDGYVNVERYLTGGGLAANRGYRLMSSPVNQTSATIASTNTFGLSYLKPHTYLNVTYPGVFTGGPGGTGSGFSGASIGPTIYLYKETLPASNTTYISGKHVGISAITVSGSLTSTTTGTTATVTTIHATDPTVTTSIPVGNGFLFYFVGPGTRSTGSSTVPPNDAVITANGYLNQGTFTANLWYTATGGVGKLSNSAAASPGYNMMGNPYASSLNLNTVLTDNTASIDGIYVLGSRTGGSNQNYVAYVNGGTSSPAAQGYAVSGGGFIVHVKSGVTNGTLTFNEAQKAPTQQLTGTGLIMNAPKADNMIVDGKFEKTPSKGLMVSPTTNALTGLYMKMEKDSLIYDYCGIYFKSDYLAKFGDGDARYLTGPTATVSMASLSADGVETAVNLLPDYHKGSRTKLKVSATASGLYYIKIEGIRNIDTLYDIYLIDNFKKDSLDIRRYGTYAFNLVKTDTTTFGVNRFVLSIQRKPILAFVLANFTGNKVAEGVQLNWKTYNESNYTGFTLERQTNTGGFTAIYDKQSDGSNHYSFIDRQPASGNNIYRLKQNDIDGKISYSEPVKIFYDKMAGNGLFSIFPNPTAEMINVSIPFVQKTASYKMRLYNAAGNLIMQKTSNTGNWSENVSDVKPGAYIVEVIKNDGTSMGKAKFIKR